MTTETPLLDLFMQHRQRLFGVAYRMTGSAMDAEDILQEVFIKWEKVGQSAENPSAYLTTMVTRASIDYLRSAKVKREHYMGEWLPEPIPTPTTDTVQLAESLSMAFLVLLERLTPVERAVFLLREVFDYDYSEIATMVDKSEANCRKIATRARQHVNEHRPRFTPTTQSHEMLLAQFLQACSMGDLQGLMSILHQDAILVSDGGGEVKTATRPIFGADHIGRFFLGLMKRSGGNVYPRFVSVNGQTGIALYYEGRLFYVMLIEADASQIHRFYIIANPQKLTRIIE